MVELPRASLLNFAGTDPALCHVLGASLGFKTWHPYLYLDSLENEPRGDSHTGSNSHTNSSKVPTKNPRVMVVRATGN